MCHLSSDNYVPRGARFPARKSATIKLPEDSGRPADPDAPGAWLIPAYATTIRPPTVPEGCVAIFNGGLSAVGEWRIELAADQMRASSLQ